MRKSWNQHQKWWNHQPTSQILPTKEIMSDEYDTWPEGSWVPILKTENQFNENVMGPTSEVVEPPAQFQYAGGYGQTDYEQPMFQVLLTEDIMSHEYDTWPASIFVPIPKRENQFNEDIMGPISEVVESLAQLSMPGTMSSPCSMS